MERNWCAGLRTPTTMASDEAFRVANRKIWKLYYGIAAALFVECAGVMALALTVIWYVVGIKAAKSATEKAGLGLTESNR
ncbi:MAG: SdpI family protein [Corynebacterium sp.]|nr:SdpI family protein [Corynebacterium sp.]MDO5099269.1 SdpI family protein [Corynebacterium sp.]